MSELSARTTPSLYYEPLAYPTYPSHAWFVEAVGAEALEDWLAAIQALEPQRQMSLLVRVPHAAPQASIDNAWLDALQAEAALYRQRGGALREICEVYFSAGIGQLRLPQLERFIEPLLANFQRAAAARIKIALDPGAVSPAIGELLPCLAAQGVEAVDIALTTSAGAAAGGVVKRVGDALRRRHSLSLSLAATVRDAAPRASIGLTLGYGGAPRAAERTLRFLDEVLSFAPQRIQLRLDQSLDGAGASESSNSGDREYRPRPLRPSALRARLPVLREIAARLAACGYQRIGPSHYAQATDPSVVAQRRGCLTLRSFGISTHPGSTTLAIGPGAIGSVGPVYYENLGVDAAYLAALARGALPIFKGLHLSADDLVRRAVLISLACNQFIDIPAIETGHGVAFAQSFPREMAELEVLDRHGLVALSTDAIEVTGDGLLLLDSICMIFDAYLPHRRGRAVAVMPR